MKTVEKLFLWLIPFLIIISARDSVVGLIKDHLFDEISKGEFDTLYEYFIIFSNLLISKGTVINICCAFCLFFLSKQKANSWWTWPIIGLFYGFYSICFYFLLRLRDTATHTSQKLETDIVPFSRLLVPLLVIVPGLSLIVFSATVIPSGTVKIPTLFSNSQVSSYFFIVLMLLPYLSKLVAAIWLWRISKQSTSLRWIWALFTLFVGLLIPILFILIESIEKPILIQKSNTNR